MDEKSLHHEKLPSTLRKGERDREIEGMEEREPEGSHAPPPLPPPPYTLPPIRLCSEDILFVIDADVEAKAEMKNSGPRGKPVTRLDSIKQAVLLFVHSKLTINPDHRFALASLTQSPAWLRKEFTSNISNVLASFRMLSVADSSCGVADLTNLFIVAANEGKRCQAESRIFRVILFYCRSSTPPQYKWTLSQKNFTLDVIYLHDKPGPENCPQRVYDALVDALDQVSEYDGYIFESGQGLSRTLFRQTCVLLSHPQQRCGQDDIDIPKPLARKSVAAEAGEVQ
ncbi:hypothetical protein QJS04_geneDACA002526 [Acorus gramineus]|uniref:BRISC and BRCA1-A complex member 1 n=1 Tax=Acorus gramineus TaxID=55184 RepID=A0AAV9ASQ0_ACOGR|nr:hypothetical protein QJS04_geneDACA002526 [Acorus gramineus]